jgi:pimeloyl-ACP methyl ester carboxylesterase
MPPHAFEAQCDASLNHEALERLHEISSPAVITIGDRDIFTPIRYSQEIHGRMPNSILSIFDGWGHVHHWENYKKFNSSTTQFLLDHKP